MEEQLVNCCKIAVNCVKNDPVDVRSGGPAYLGFDFYVRVEEAEKMKIFIKETLESLKVPLISMYRNIEDRELPLNKVWDSEKIFECIANDANYLIHEASCSHIYRR